MSDDDLTALLIATPAHLPDGDAFGAKLSGTRRASFALRCHC